MSLIAQIFGVLAILAGIFMILFPSESPKPSIEFKAFTRTSFLFGIIFIIIGIILLRL